MPKNSSNYSYTKLSYALRLQQNLQHFLNTGKSYSFCRRKPMEKKPFSQQNSYMIKEKESGLATDCYAKGSRKKQFLTENRFFCGSLPKKRQKCFKLHFPKFVLDCEILQVKRSNLVFFHEKFKIFRVRNEYNLLSVIFIRVRIQTPQNNWGTVIHLH